MKLLTEIDNKFEYEVIKEESTIPGNKPKLFVKGIIQRANAKNQNGRIYPREILFREIENYKNLIKERRATGELDHCLLGTSEILTNHGWKFLKDIANDEIVYTLNLETNCVEEEKILEKIEIDYKGKMYEIKNGKKFSIITSPNHRNLLWDRNDEPYYIKTESLINKHNKKDSSLSHSFASAKKGFWNENHNTPEYFSIPNSDFKIPSMAWSGLMGIWLSEGYVDSNINSKKKNYRVQITQIKEENKILIRNLLKETNLPWKEYKKGNRSDWVVSNKQIHAYFSQFGKSHEKYIPRYLLNWSQDHMNELLKWLLIGDGRNRKNKKEIIKEYSTVSLKLANDVSELMLRLGYKPFIKKTTPKDVYIHNRLIEGKNCKTLYTVSGNTSDSYLDSRYVKINEINHDGKIYCVRTKNKNFLMRSENGNVLWTGNCDEPVINLKNVSHVITDIWYEGDTVLGKIEILPTPMGDIARSLIESEIKLGISSRALGSVYNRGDADVVQDDLNLICWDLVSEPSTHNAFMMKEGREYSRNEIKQILEKNNRVGKVVQELNRLLIK